MSENRPSPSRRSTPDARTKLTLFDIPEVNVALFAFLLNFPWEFLQTPLFAVLPQQPHWEATKICALASLDDVAITLFAYWVAAIAGRSRRWVIAPRARTLSVFIATGLIVTSVAELLATGPLQRWRYSELMPTTPVVEVGIIPLLQWVILPLLCVVIVRRQLS